MAVSLVSLVHCPATPTHFHFPSLQADNTTWPAPCGVLWYTRRHNRRTPIGKSMHALHMVINRLYPLRVKLIMSGWLNDICCLAIICFSWLLLIEIIRCNIIIILTSWMLLLSNNIFSPRNIITAILFFTNDAQQNYILLLLLGCYFLIINRSLKHSLVLKTI